jgi:methylglutaconyl-CoA hydratase
MAHPNLIIEQRGAVASLTINRPDHDNKFDDGMMAAMVDALGGLDGGVRVVLLAGVGEHFCGGRDPGPTQPDDAAGWRQLFGQIVATNEALTVFPGITIALAKGRVSGFGFGLAVQCDITLTAEDTRLSFPEIKAGFPPAVVMSYLSRYTDRKRAFELVITGDEIRAAQAERFGLVNCVVPPEELEAEGQRWVDKLLKLDAAALTACKAFFRDSASLPLDEVAAYGVSFLTDFKTGS